MISNSVCRAFKTCKDGSVKVWSASFFLHRLSNTFKRLWQRFLNKISTESFQAYRSANPVRGLLPWMWNVITMRTFNCLKTRWFSPGRLLSLIFTFYLTPLPSQILLLSADLPPILVPHVQLEFCHFEGSLKTDPGRGQQDQWSAGPGGKYSTIQHSWQEAPYRGWGGHPDDESEAKID